MQEYNLRFMCVCIDKYLGEIIYLFKVLLALIEIFLIYTLYYPYYFLKEKLFSSR